MPLFQKVGFLFLFIYLFLYANSTQFLLSGIVEPLWQRIIPWFADLVGHSEAITVFTNGSGDTTYNYFQILFFGVVALLFAILVVAFDRKRINYSNLLSWLTLLLRYYMAVQMINYGLAKLFYLQFGYPSAARLDQALGDFSPMGLLWTFMGYSKGYTMFTGALEFIAGLFLLSRRTTTLGALMTFGVMLNVMMLNYCYDVPVKLLSTHLVLMSLFIIALDGKRLLRFFVSNETVSPYMLKSAFPEKFQRPIMIIKWFLVVFYLGFSLYSTNSMSKIYGPNAPKPEFYGKYAVESFRTYNDGEENEEVPDWVRWDAFYQSYKGYARVRTADDNEFSIQLNTDSTNVMNIEMQGDSLAYNLNYEKLDSVRYHVYGKFKQDSINMVFNKEDVMNRTLTSRGFQWINEYPYNR